MKDGRGGKWANAALQKGYSHHNDCMPHHEYVKWQPLPLAPRGLQRSGKIQISR